MRPCGKTARSEKNGFALIEVLIAVTILSVIIVSLYSGVSTGALAIAQNKNMTSAILIARSKLNEFKNSSMRGTDVSSETVEEYPGFTWEREIVQYENELLPELIQAKVVTITVHWKYNNRDRSFSLDYIFTN
ncbi:MAG: type IV pilus modification PilV family protein [Spirochaetota bacterium]